jgi:hypothetical protein
MFAAVKGFPFFEGVIAGVSLSEIVGADAGTCVEVSEPETVPETLSNGVIVGVALGGAVGAAVGLQCVGVTTGGPSNDRQLSPRLMLSILEGGK